MVFAEFVWSEFMPLEDAPNPKHFSQQAIADEYKHDGVKSGVQKGINEDDNLGSVKVFFFFIFLALEFFMCKYHHRKKKLIISTPNIPK